MKKLLTVVVLLVLTVALVACSHTHSFDKYASDGDYHWLVCSQDGEIQEGSRAKHVDDNSDGVCDVCGYKLTEKPQRDPIVVNFSGQINLVKSSQTTQSGSGVSIKLSDGNNEFEPDNLIVNAKGLFSFDALEGQYTLRAIKSGYQDYEAIIELDRDDLISDYVVELKYNLLKVAPIPSWDASNHDLSRQNEGVLLMNGGNTLNVITSDPMDNVVCTYYAKKGQSTSTDDRIGVWVQFYSEDASSVDCAWLTTYGADNTIEWYTGGFWGDNMSNIAPSGTSFPLTAQELAQYKRGTLKIAIARSGNVLYALINDVVRSTVQLGSKYADMDCHIGLLSWNPAINQDIKYSIEEFKDETETIITDTVVLSQKEKNIDLDNSKYAYWEAYGESEVASSEKDLIVSNAMNKVLCINDLGYTLSSNGQGFENARSIAIGDTLTFEFTITNEISQAVIYLESGLSSTYITVDYESQGLSGMITGSYENAMVRFAFDTSKLKDGQSQTIRVTVSASTSINCLGAALVKATI